MTVCRCSKDRTIFTAALISISLIGFFIIAFQGAAYGQTTGSLKVYSGITGANVYVNGVNSGSTDAYSGATVNGLVAGTFSLKLSLAGYKDWTKQVTIASGQTTTVYAYLEAGSGISLTRSETLSYNSAIGSLKVNTGITGVNIYVNDEYGGSTDAYSGATVKGLIAGTFSLKLSLAGYKDWTKQVTIASGQTTTVYAYLEAGSGISLTRSETLSYNSAEGSLKVNTGFTGVSVYVGDEYGGKTDAYSGATVNGLVTGTYSLKLSMAGYKDWTKQVSITASQTTTVYAYLESGSGISLTRSETLSYNSAEGSLKVNTGFTGVSVYVGDEYGGKTDAYSGATVNGLVTGTYSLKLSMAGYKDWTKQVSITTGKTTTVYAYLENGAGTGVTRSETISYDSPYGSLKVNTGITGVNVYVNDEYGGSTDAYSGATVNGLINGIYTLKLTSTDYYELTQQVTITTGQTTTVQATLTPRLTSTTTPTPTPTPTPQPLGDFWVTVSSGYGGNITGGGGFTTPGTSYTFTITPNSGYRILDVKVDGVSQGNISTYRLTNIQRNHEISATFSSIKTLTPSPLESTEPQQPSMLILYIAIIAVNLFVFLLATYFILNRRRSLTVIVKGKGTTYPSPGIQKYKKGNQATVEAIPDLGWEFNQWSGDDNGKKNPITITMNSHRTLTASFILAEGKRQVFISHGEEDAATALEIAKNLENNDYRAWYYERDSVPGQSYIIKTSQAIEQSQAVILIISPHSMRSHQVHTEVITAHEAGKPFIPVLKDVTHLEFQSCQPEWRRVMGAAASISIPKQGISEILPRILKGLKELGVKKKGDL